MRLHSFTVASVWRFLALALVPLVIVGFLAGTQASRAQRESVGWRNSVTASAVEAEVGAFLAAPVTALDGLTSVAGDVRARAQLGASIMRHFPSVESVVLVDKTGRSVYATAAPGASANASDVASLDRSRDPLFLDASATNRPAWSDVFTSISSGRRAVEVSVPASDFVAIATIGIDTLSEAVRRAPTHEGLEVVVLDGQGTVLFHTLASIAAQRPNWRDVEPVAQSIAGTFGQFEYLLDGTPQFGSTARVQGANWTVLVQQRRDIALAPVNAVWNGIITAVVVVALISGLVAVMFARNLSRPIAELSARARQVERGDYSSGSQRYRFGEIADLGQSIGRMADAVSARESDLRSARDELLHSYEDLTHAIAEKEAALAGLSAMSAELIATEERERRHLAEELHDRVSQALAVARMRLKIANAEDMCDAEQLTAIDDLLGQAIVQTRAITSELSPPILYELGLAPAVGTMIDEMATNYRLVVHSQVDINDEGLSEKAKMALYRASRELLANVVKHSGVLEVWITLHREEDRTVLSVRDEGVGFDVEPGVVTDHFGLFSIRERLSRLGGRLLIRSAPGEGTFVTAEVPNRTPDAEPGEIQTG